MTRMLSLAGLTAVLCLGCSGTGGEEDLVIEVKPVETETTTDEAAKDESTDEPAAEEEAKDEAEEAATAPTPEPEPEP